ncbi:Dps family protein [Fulvivirgaceae bacterium BMA10]|uniref:Dps family protein n=1 Tax=Splendidivirga corallicola TaxID=3051826 RepID=A0ABT8KRD6_9BACT|nr:Dps family protein [Fulvivirgaceae bacterium BMA10]
MSNVNMIGIEIQEAERIAEELNGLLSDLQIFYQNLRGFHWNIQGQGFFDLHQKFEELYNEAAVNIDDVAERILALDAVPFHSFENYLSNSGIQSTTNVHDAETAVMTVVNNLQKLIIKEKEVLSLANEADDEGSATLVSDMIKVHEKTSWMFRAWLK